MEKTSLRVIGRWTINSYVATLTDYVDNTISCLLTIPIYLSFLNLDNRFLSRIEFEMHHSFIECIIYIIIISDYKHGRYTDIKK